MTDYSVLAGSLGTPRPKPPCEPILKPVVDEPWKYADACAEVDLRSGGACECGRGCGLRANIHHHIAGRGGANPHHPDNLKHLHDSCHQWAHDHPEQAYELGLMRKRNR